MRKLIFIAALLLQAVVVSKHPIQYTATMSGSHDVVCFSSTSDPNYRCPENQSQPTGANYLPVMTGTTGSIGGGLLAVGASASGTATVTGATVGMLCIAQPSDGTDMAAVGAIVSCTVTANNTATVRVVAVVTVTPASKQYNVRILP